MIIDNNVLNILDSMLIDANTSTLKKEEYQEILLPLFEYFVLADQIDTKESCNSSTLKEFMDQDEGPQYKEASHEFFNDFEEVKGLSLLEVYMDHFEFFSQTLESKLLDFRADCYMIDDSISKLEKLPSVHSKLELVTDELTNH